MGSTDSVQKATNLKKESKGFRAMSALISAASPEKMDGNTKLRATSGTMNIHQQSSPLGHR